MDTPKIIITPFEMVSLKGVTGEWLTLDALVDTGAQVSSIDVELAQKLGLLTEANTLFERSYASALGRQRRPVIGVTFKLGEHVIKSRCSVADRSNRKQKFLVGRLDLEPFAIVQTKK